ncbi:four helix bundle protein [Reichenbachiella ulvae]|uniref:Four helix bundle protein n=1 Tax=Reichenbachiella ulvae TaxID=2980104 RepID=A0ABT3CQS8_9BACT|nr:four helix bundle protein [Reichenbachiella ulvae]MCV9386061.1 four helix bundle protein [Reichenbachiella ulvae]
MRDYRKYKVWEMGHELTLSIYRITQSFPDSEKYSVISQMQRAAYSIPSNIAEGCGRDSNAEFVRFLVIARGSATELEYFLLLSKELNYLGTDQYEALFDKVNQTKRSLNNLIEKVKSV